MSKSGAGGRKLQGGGVEDVNRKQTKEDDE
jgi:hypothetical protein